MSRVPRLIGKSGFMHIYSRGVNKQDIFLRNSDYSFFLKKLKDLSEELEFDLIAYCLMPNHYHLVIFDEKRQYSTIIKRLSISYAMHFNVTYERVGPLFQGRFCGKPIENEGYLKTVIRYIHLNPEKAGICSMKLYKWSSYKEYVQGQYICRTEKVLSVFGGLVKFTAFHEIGDDELHEELEGNDITDEEAIRVVCAVIKEENPVAITQFCKEKRDKCIEEIKKLGIQSKQLSRITGLSIFVIRHVHVHTNKKRLSAEKTAK